MAGANTVFERLCEQTSRLMEQKPVPGIALGVLQDGQIETAGLGVTSLDNPLPVTADTLFQIGSITKTFTATMAMRLVEQGLLDLEKPLRNYMPDLTMSGPGVAEKVTLLHLLTHTGGWEGDYFNDYGWGEDALARITQDVMRLPQITPLGEIYAYNNAGFYLAGRVLEIVTGKSYEKLAREMVLDPLGMDMSFFFPDDVMTRRFVAGHIVENGKAKVGRPWSVPRAVAPVGGLVSTVKDLLKYAQFHMGDGTAPDGTRLLSRESLELMQTPRFPATGIYWMGITWRMIPLENARVIGHGGATLGQGAMLRFVPERQFATVMLTNSDMGESIYEPYLQSSLQEYLGFNTPYPQPLDLPVDQLLPYCGRYSHISSDLFIYLEGNRLMVRSENKPGFPTPESPASPNQPPDPVALYGTDKLMVLDEPYTNTLGEFLRGSDGEIVWLRLGGRVHRRET